MPSRRRVLALTAALLLAGCPEAVPDAQVNVKILKGDLDPLSDPGTVERDACPVGSLKLSWVSDTDRTSTEVAIGANRSVDAKLPVRPSAGRLSIRGLRATDGADYSAGQTVPVVAKEGEPVETTLFLGPLETFTPVGPDLPGPRMGAAAATFGNEGALIVGGYSVDGSGAAVLASPSVVVYRLADIRACSFDEGCLTGALPPPRRDAIAQPLADGSVVHGLGRLADGSPDSTLYLTSPGGATEALTLTGEVLPALWGAASVTLDDGALIILGGHDGSAPSRNVYRVDVATRVVTLLEGRLYKARARAGAIALTPEQVLVLGGEGTSGTLLEAEVYDAALGGLLVDGGAFAQARKLLRAARLSPTLVKLRDDSVLVAGGGSNDLEIFRADIGAAVGGFVDVVAAPPERQQKTPGCARFDNGDVVFAGGEAAGSPAAAWLFVPEPDQVLGPAKPVYGGSWRPLGASLTARAAASLVPLADGSLLLAGGGTSGEVATGPNSGAARVEVLVASPVE